MKVIAGYTISSPYYEGYVFVNTLKVLNYKNKKRTK